MIPSLVGWDSGPTGFDGESENLMDGNHGTLLQCDPAARCEAILAVELTKPTTGCRVTCIERSLIPANNPSPPIAYPSASPPWARRGDRHGTNNQFSRLAFLRDVSR